MIFLWLSPLFIALNAYYIYEVCKLLTAIGNAVKGSIPGRIIKVVKIVFAVIWSLASVSIYIAFLMPEKLSKENMPLLYGLKRTFKLIGNYHLGVFMYMGMALMPVLLCRLIEYIICRLRGKTLTKDTYAFHLRRSIAGVIYVAFVVIVTLIGVHKAGDIKTRRYDVDVHKDVHELREADAGEKADSSELKIVMVADLHLGYNIGCRQMEKMVALINAEDADIVVVAGDIFDNEYEALDDPDRLAEILSSIRSRYGVYAVYGNHDISERIIGGFTFNWHDPGKGSSDDMDAFMDRCGFKLLCDDYVCIDDSFYLYGRPDYEKPGKWVDVRRTPKEIAGELDMTKPVIVIDHEPRELQELSDAGIDIDLCGHTHDGQFFPMNLTSRYLTWENSAGLLMKGDMSNIVTSGVGLFGPNIRIGTQAEICAINVHFGN